MDELLSWVNIYENSPHLSNVQDDANKTEEDYSEVFKAFMTDVNANDLVKPALSQEKSDQEENSSNKCARIKQRRNGIYMPRGDLKMKNLMDEVENNNWDIDTPEPIDSTETSNEQTKPSITTPSSIEELLLLLNNEADTEEQVTDFPIPDSDQFDPDMCLQYFADH